MGISGVTCMCLSFKLIVSQLWRKHLTTTKPNSLTESRSAKHWKSSRSLAFYDVFCSPSSDIHVKLLPQRCQGKLLWRWRQLLGLSTTRAEQWIHAHHMMLILLHRIFKCLLLMEKWMEIQLFQIILQYVHGTFSLSPAPSLNST